MNIYLILDIGIVFTKKPNKQTDVAKYKYTLCINLSHVGILFLKADIYVIIDSNIINIYLIIYYTIINYNSVINSRNVRCLSIIVLYIIVSPHNIRIIIKDYGKIIALNI